MTKDHVIIFNEKVVEESCRAAVALRGEILCSLCKHSRPEKAEHRAVAKGKECERCNPVQNIQITFSVHFT